MFLLFIIQVNEYVVKVLSDNLTRHLIMKIADIWPSVRRYVTTHHPFVGPYARMHTRGIKKIAGVFLKEIDTDRR